MIFNVIILAILFAIIMWMGLKDGEEKHLEEIKALILSTSQANSDYTRAVDVEAVADAVRSNGYEPDIDGQIVSFMCYGVRMVLGIERPKLISIMVSCAIPQGWDIELVRKASGKVMEDIMMVKTFVCPDDSENSVAFRIDVIESNYTHFRDNLDRYVSILLDSSGYLRIVYEKMSQKENETDTSDIQEKPMALPQSNGWVS